MRRPKAWLLNVWRGKLEYPDLHKKVKFLASGLGAGRILVEGAGSGLSLIQDLSRSTDLNVIGRLPKGDKATRMMSVSAVIEAGRVLIPKEATWLAEFQRELTLFPNALHDDQIDSQSQFLAWLEQPQFEWYVGSAD